MVRAHQRLVMLAHVLAVLLGFSSFVFYIAAFFYPEVHRRSDILWSGLGMFYALALWFSSGQMTATVLLGQVISVALLVGLGWQTLTVRREKTPVYQQTPITLTPEVVGSWAKNKINQLRIAPDDTVRPLPPQNRSLTATAADRFRQDIDPRRRPVYDYEFVEDGEVENGEFVEEEIAPPSVETATVNFKDLNFEKLDALEEDALEEGLEDTDIIPPSAAAKILSEATPEAESQATKAASKETEDAIEAVSQKTEETLEDSASPAEETVSPEKNEVVETDAIERAETLTVVSSNDAEANSAATEAAPPSPEQPQPLAEPNAAEVAQSETAIEQSEASAEVEAVAEEKAVAIEEDDWGFAPDDEWSTTEDQNTGPAQELLRQPQTERAQSEQSQVESPRTSNPKPSLLATPVILLGWVKDVIGSMAKPKPSKPVINIPRRDPNAPDARQSRSATEPITNQGPIEPATGNASDSASARTQPFSPPPTTQTFTPEPVPTSSPDLDNSGNFDDDDDWEEASARAQPFTVPATAQAFTPEPPPTPSTDVDNSGNFDDDDDWEDSNWDD